MHAVLFLFCFVISTLRLLLISRYSSVLLHFHSDNDIPTPVKLPCNARDVSFMMTSSDGNIFRVTDPMCRDFTGEVPSQKSVTRSFHIFSLICAWTRGWVNNRDAGDLRRLHAHYDATLMWRTWIQLTKLQQNTTKHKSRALFLRRSSWGSHPSV